MALPNITLTPALVQQNLQNDGLDTLGLTTVRLSPTWASMPSTITYNSSDLTLDISGNVMSPFIGLREFTHDPTESTLASTISDSETTLPLAAGTGNQFPSPSITSPVMFRLSNSQGTKAEIVACTGRTGDNLTVVRGLEGSMAQSFAVGDKVIFRVPLAARTAQFTGADGSPLTGHCVTVRMHPQAYLRLETLMAKEYAAVDGTLVYPVPATLVVHGIEAFITPRWCQAGDTISALPQNPQLEVPVTGKISFHDIRGLIIDPIFVAELFAGLLNTYQGLRPTGAMLAAMNNDPVGVAQIAQKTSGTLLHFVDLHGDNYRKAFSGGDMVTVDASDAATATLSNGFLPLKNNEGVRAADSAADRLRWGWATNGVMRQDILKSPGAFAREFLRVAVVDVDWALLGNRTSDAILKVKGDDGRIPELLLPTVRDKVNVDYLVDGPDMLAKSMQVMNRPNDNMFFVVSPDIDNTMDIPLEPGEAAHWPMYQGADTGLELDPDLSLANSVSASFTANHDVRVTIQGGMVPNGAHVRIYPSQFVEIAAIAEEPSFVRADGGAALVSGASDVIVLLPNPFGLTSGQPPPNPAVLTMDIVITPRKGKRRIFGSVSTTVNPSVTQPLSDSFAFDPMGTGHITVVDQLTGIAESPLFGIPRTLPKPPQPPPGDFLAMIASLTAEPSPRQAPRLPTMARFDTLVVKGVTFIDEDGNPATTTDITMPKEPGTLLWEAVLSGGRLTRESRSAFHDSGNPGNPAGSDIPCVGRECNWGIGV